MMDGLETCPYNNSHQVKTTRFQAHLLRCQEQHPDIKLVRCLFNATHLVPVEKRLEHLKICQDVLEISIKAATSKDSKSCENLVKDNDVDKKVQEWLMQTNPRRCEDKIIFFETASIKCEDRKDNDMITNENFIGQDSQDSAKKNANIATSPNNNNSLLSDSGRILFKHNLQFSQSSSNPPALSTKNVKRCQYPQREASYFNGKCKSSSKYDENNFSYSNNHLSEEFKNTPLVKNEFHSPISPSSLLSREKVPYKECSSIVSDSGSCFSNIWTRRQQLRQHSSVVSGSTCSSYVQINKQPLRKNIVYEVCPSVVSASEISCSNIWNRRQQLRQFNRASSESVCASDSCRSTNLTNGKQYFNQSFTAKFNKVSTCDSSESDVSSIVPDDSASNVGRIKYQKYCTNSNEGSSLTMHTAVATMSVACQTDAMDFAKVSE